MIRAHQAMLLRARGHTDRMLLLLDPDEQLGLKALVDARRAQDGAVPFPEHAVQAVLERLARANGHTTETANGAVQTVALEALLEEAVP